MRHRREQTSLFGEILDWMLVPLLVLWPMSLGVTAFVAQQISNLPYDRELGELARLLAGQVVVGEAPRAGDLPLVRLRPDRALELLRSDDTDQVYFQVLGVRGELVTVTSRCRPRRAMPMVPCAFATRRCTTSRCAWPTCGCRCRVTAKVRGRWCNTPKPWTSARAWPPRSSRA
jgi:hypothetical protein